MNFGQYNIITLVLLQLEDVAKVEWDSGEVWRYICSRSAHLHIPQAVLRIPVVWKALLSVRNSTHYTILCATWLVCLGVTDWQTTNQSRSVTSRTTLLFPLRNVAEATIQAPEYGACIYRWSTCIQSSIRWDELITHTQIGRKEQMLSQKTLYWYCLRKSKVHVNRP